MPFDIAKHTIFLTITGSHAHGTSTAESDVDLRGVCVAPMSTRLSLFETFEQQESGVPDAFDEIVASAAANHPTASQCVGSKVECTIFDVEKFVRLCVNANPNALEVLFADPKEWVYTSRVWDELYDNRHAFLTKKVAQTFNGYAMAQLKRIKTHRSWLLNPPKRQPKRSDFGLPDAYAVMSKEDQSRIEQAIADRVRSYGIDNVDMPKPIRLAVIERMVGFYRDALGAGDDTEERMRAVATHALGIPADVVTALNAERRYRAALKHWDSFKTWKRQRNPARAELERQHGYDTKHAMHLVRLMRMGIEALANGELNVKRSDADDLRAIRAGAIGYDDLVDTAESLQAEITKAQQTTRLPDEVDREWVDRLVLEMVT